MPTTTETVESETTADEETVDLNRIDPEDLLEKVKENDMFDELEDEFRENIEDQKIRNAYRENIGYEPVVEQPPLSAKLPVAIQFLINCFVSTKTVVTDATVETVDLRRGDVLELTVSGPDTRPVPDRSDDRTHTETFRLDLNDHDDKKQLESLLDAAGVATPDALDGKSIPVYTHVPSTYRYELYQPAESPKDHIMFGLSRAFRRLRMVSTKWSTDTSTGYTVWPTKNLALVFALIGGALSLAIGNNEVLAFILPYIATVVYTLLRGTIDAFMNKSGERDWIRQLIE